MIKFKEEIEKEACESEIDRVAHDQFVNGAKHAAELILKKMTKLIKKEPAFYAALLLVEIKSYIEGKK